MTDEDLANLEQQLADIPEPDSVDDVTLMATPAILSELRRIRTDLLNLGELMKPETAAGRELHSRRAALLIERNVRVK